jgi:hypothetical protein
MSRTTTPQLAPPAGPTPAAQVPPEKIALRAYHKWVQRGCTHGRDQQDWVEAEAELRAELTRQGTTSGSAFGGARR